MSKKVISVQIAGDSMNYLRHIIPRDTCTKVISTHCDLMCTQPTIYTFKNGRRCIPTYRASVGSCNEFTWECFMQVPIYHWAECTLCTSKHNRAFELHRVWLVYTQKAYVHCTYIYICLQFLTLSLCKNGHWVAARLAYNVRGALYMNHVPLLFLQPSFSLTGWRLFHASWDTGGPRRIIPTLHANGMRELLLDCANSKKKTLHQIASSPCVYIRFSFLLCVSALRISN